MEDDTLFAELYGTAAPAKEIKQSRKAALPSPPVTRPAQVQEAGAKRKTNTWSREALSQPQPQSQPQQQLQPQQTDAALEVVAVDTDDDELEVNLDLPAEEDDELDIDLDESRQTAFESERPAPGPLAAGKQGSGALAQPSSTPFAPAESGLHAPRPPHGGLAPGASVAHTSSASSYGGLASFASGPAKRPEQDLPPAFPQQAQPGQKIKLPGQSRVAPEEYREFLILGHGGVFDLDVDNVVDAPWKAYGADPQDFFNYGFNMVSWRDYCRRVKQFRSEFALQKKIQTYEGANQFHPRNSDLPPELAAAVAAETEAEMAARAATPTLPYRSGFSAQQAQNVAARESPYALEQSKPALALPANERAKGAAPSSAAQLNSNTAKPPSDSADSPEEGQLLSTSTRSAPDSKLQRPGASNGQTEDPTSPAFPALMEDSMFGSVDLAGEGDHWRQPKRFKGNGWQ